MKIMWITNVPVGDICNKLGLPKAISGGWMVALLDDMKKVTDIQLVLATTGKTKDTILVEFDAIKSYLLPGGIPSNYNYKLKSNRLAWKHVLDLEKPDLIHLWGTEFSHGLVAMEMAPNIPVVVYIQGLVSVIARYYEAGMDKMELLKSISFRDIIKGDWICAQKSKFTSRGITEREILNRAKNVICENQWCRTHCSTLVNDCKFYTCELNIKDVYYKADWSQEGMEPYSIMGIASNYPLKGLHMLIKAFNIVIKRYPQAKLYVPGVPTVPQGGIKNRLKQTGYSLYIQRLINEFGLKDKVIFLGSLTADKMAEWMSKTNVFVMPSAIENHSSSLREAMIVGTPSIASFVGGIPEVVTHGQNGLLYRFEEYEMLAEYISKVFDDLEFATSLSQNARISMRSNHDSMKISEKIIAIYRDIISSTE